VVGRKAHHPSNGAGVIHVEVMLIVTVEACRGARCLESYDWIARNRITSRCVIRCVNDAQPAHEKPWAMGAAQAAPFRTTIFAQILKVDRGVSHSLSLTPLYSL
jgi:hypothetical protein